MADKELINTSIDEYLISLANSINHAQRYISQLRVVGQDGQPTVTYQLPKVEFELKLLFQLDTKHPPSGSSQRDMAKGEGSAFLEARPISFEAGEEDSTTAAAASTIKGAFVAVPIHGGTPPPVVNIAWEELSINPKKIKITVSVRSAIGDALNGCEVEFNLEKGLARKLNEDYRNEKDKDILPLTSFASAVLLTAGKGEVENILTIKDNIKKLKVPVVIDVMGTTKTIIFTPDDLAA